MSKQSKGASASVADSALAKRAKVNAKPTAATAAAIAAHPARESLVVFPALRKDYALLPTMGDVPVSGKLHGLGVDTAHPLVRVGAMSKNYLVAALHKAFTDHLPIVLRPDDIWLTILQGFAIHVTEHADELRELVLKPSKTKGGKIALSARDDSLQVGNRKNDWTHVFGSFTDQIKQHTVKGTSDLLSMGFSTSTAATTMAGQCVVFKVLASYFSYHTFTMCGIPEVFLRGTVSDWVRLKQKVLLLRQYKLDWWLEHLLPICDEFVLLSQYLHGQGDLSAASRNFWKSIYKYGNASGGPKVTGWVNALFPYHTGGQATFSRNRSMDWNWRSSYNKVSAKLAEIRAKQQQAASAAAAAVVSEGGAAAPPAVPPSTLPALVLTKSDLKSCKQVSEALSAKGATATAVTEYQSADTYSEICVDGLGHDIECDALSRRWSGQKDYMVVCADQASWDTVKQLSNAHVLTELERAVRDFTTKQLEAKCRTFVEYRSMNNFDGIGPGSFPPGYTAAPMVWTYLGKNIDTEMSGGFFGCAQNPKNFALEPVIGWSVSTGEIEIEIK